MSALLDRLPGDIEGLWREGSFAIDADGVVGLVVVAPDETHEGIVYPHGAGTGPLPLTGWSFWLGDPTGRVHAVWWVDAYTGPLWASITHREEYLLREVRLGRIMLPEEVDILARLVLRLARRD